MSAVETLGVTAAQAGFSDCACPRPLVATLGEGSVPTPATAVLERGTGVGVREIETDCACPDGTQVQTGVEVFKAADQPVAAKPDVNASIQVNVVLPQA